MPYKSVSLDNFGFEKGICNLISLTTKVICKTNSCCCYQYQNIDKRINQISRKHEKLAFMMKNH